MNSTYHGDTSYEKLRNWYLARLRRAALATDQAGLTPVGLIAKDREWVEKLVLEAATREAVLEKRALPDSALLKTSTISILFTGTILLQLALLCPLLLATVQAVPVEPTLITVLLVANFCVTAVIAVAARKNNRVMNWFLQIISIDTGQQHNDNDKNSLLTQILSRLGELLKMVEESKVREKIIADSADELLICLDGELKVLAVNRFIFTCAGFAPEEFAGLHLVSRIVPDDLTGACDLFSRARERNEPETFVSRILTRQQQAVDLEWTVEWSGSEEKYFAIAKDVTDRMNIERMKRESNAMLGHDIKIPLTSISCSLTLMKMGVYGKVPDSFCDVINRVENSAKRLIALIDELLDFEKLADKKMPLSLAKIDIETIARRALDETEGQSSSKEVEVSLVFEKANLETDEEKILRVLINLTSNAIKYSPIGGEVAITGKKFPEHFEIRVKDQGPGIARENHSMIFERYARVANEGAPAMEGTGLGLAICKAIVESHGGLIGVESKPGSGSVFWFTLPLSGSQSR